MDASVSPTSHPRGLYVLFLTELWERYSFYSMMAILTLYMDESLHFDGPAIGRVYGAYIAGVYFLPVLGGWLADRVTGFYRAVLVGGGLMLAGHLLLALDSRPTFFVALALLAAGSGLLKPNVSAIVGNLYLDRPELRDRGYNIFYMGINLGAFVSPLAVAALRARFGWAVAFGSAAVAMGLSMIVFVGGRRHIRDASRRGVVAVSETTAAAHSTKSNGAVLFLVLAVSTVFWLAFYQNGLTLTFFARDNTTASFPPEAFQSLEPLGVIVFTPLVVWIWKRLAARAAEPASLTKMLIGVLVVAAAFALVAAAAGPVGDRGRVSQWWLVCAYGIIALGEIAFSPTGLSLVNGLAAPSRRGLMMGAWFASLAAGGYFAGWLGGYWLAIPHAAFFLIVAGILFVTAALLTLLKRRVGGVRGHAVTRIT